MNSIVIHHHLGLGDHIDCNGMVRYFSELYDENMIQVFSKPQYLEMVEYMYRDNEKINVNLVNDEYPGVIDFLNQNESTVDDFFRVGHEHYPKNPADDKNCWEYFYEQLEFDYDVKYDYFSVVRDMDEEKRVYNKLNPSDEDYIFVHDDESRGFKIDVENDLKIIRNDITENIFYFPMILEKAKEIHVMESSFKSMVEHFDVSGDLYFHDFRQHPLGRHVKNWKVVEYAS